MRVLLRPIRGRAGHPAFDAIAEEVLEEMRENVGPELLAYFTKITRNWRHKPKFSAFYEVTRNASTVSVEPYGPNAPIWQYVSRGTRPHLIPKGGARVQRAKGYPLRFQWGGPGSYRPRTSAGGHYNGPGRVVGGRTVRFWQVHHPGNRPRDFERHIARWYRPKFRRRIENAMRRGARKV